MPLSKKQQKRWIKRILRADKEEARRRRRERELGISYD